MSDYSGTFWAILAALFGQPTMSQHDLEPVTQSDAPISCRLDASAVGDRELITAYAYAPEARSGHFALEIQTNGSNKMRTRQGGEFALEPNETKSLATVRVNATSSDTLSGHLSLSSDGNDVSCHLTHSSLPGQENAH